MRPIGNFLLKPRKAADPKATSPEADLSRIVNDMARELSEPLQHEWLRGVKVVAETITSDTTLTADTNLRFEMLPNRRYLFRLQVPYSTSAAGDFKFRHTGPASPALVNIRRRAIAPGATAYSVVALDEAYSASDVAVTGGAGSGVVELEGLIVNGATAGDFQFQWAQNTSDAGATSVRSGSYLEYMEV